MFNSNATDWASTSTQAQTRKSIDAQFPACRREKEVFRSILRIYSDLMSGIDESAFAFVIQRSLSCCDGDVFTDRRDKTKRRISVTCHVSGEERTILLLQMFRTCDY